MQVEKIKLKMLFVLSRVQQENNRQLHLKDVVVDISFFFLNLCNFFQMEISATQNLSNSARKRCQIRLELSM